MATSTKKALAAALKKMMEVKPRAQRPRSRILLEICGVNRQTFYYHFDDVYDLLEWAFEEDANANLPKEVVYDRWKTDVIMWMKYLQENSTFALNVYNSNSRLYTLRHIKGRFRSALRSFADIVAEGRNIEKQDFEFVVEFYSECAIGFISYWLDMGMQFPREIVDEEDLRVMDNSVENPNGALPDEVNLDSKKPAGMLCPTGFFASECGIIIDIGGYGDYYFLYLLEPEVH